MTLSKKAALVQAAVEKLKRATYEQVSAETQLSYGQVQAAAVYLRDQARIEYHWSGRKIMLTPKYC
ncbi:MAG: hypothetical protein KGN33_08235 [Paracoccaceae bacterium]|nr:hypothetical protein [Paracoccaceae bacterium]